MILCVIDGESNIFNEDLLLKGKDGGLEAAEKLEEGIWNYLQQSGYKLEPNVELEFWITVFYNNSISGPAPFKANKMHVKEFCFGISFGSPRYLRISGRTGEDDAKKMLGA